MPIEITGPNAYEFQYIVTVFTTLKLLEQKGDSLKEVFVEKDNGEDIELKVNENGDKTILEIQVKSELGKLDSEKLISWLGHFENRKSNSCTLSRLLKNKGSKFIIATACRATDDLQNLIIQEGIAERNYVSISKTEKKTISELITNLDEKNGTTLEKSRNAFLKSLIPELTKSGIFENVLNRVYIWEKLTKEIL